MQSYGSDVHNTRLRASSLDPEGFRRKTHFAFVDTTTLFLDVMTKRSHLSIVSMNRFGPLSVITLSQSFRSLNRTPDATCESERGQGIMADRRITHCKPKWTVGKPCLTCKGSQIAANLLKAMRTA